MKNLYVRQCIKPSQRMAAHAKRSTAIAVKHQIESTYAAMQSGEVIAESLLDSILNSAGYGTFTLEAASQHLRDVERRLSALEEKINRRPPGLEPFFS